MAGKKCKFLEDCTTLKTLENLKSRYEAYSSAGSSGEIEAIKYVIGMLEANQCNPGLGSLVSEICPTNQYLTKSKVTEE